MTISFCLRFDMSTSLQDDSDKPSSIKHHEEVVGTQEDERAVALRLARAADPGPGFWSPRGIAFLFYALVCCMCSGDTGFDGTIMSSVNSMTQFHKFFGFDPETGADKTGIVFVSSLARTAIDGQGHLYCRPGRGVLPLRVLSRQDWTTIHHVWVQPSPRVSPPLSLLV